MKRNYKIVNFDSDDIIWALENAAEFLEGEEFPDETGVQEAANKKAAKIIRTLVKNRIKKPVKVFTVKANARSGIY